MGLFPTLIQTQSRKNLFPIFYILLFFNRFNIILSSRQKYGQIGNFKTFQEMGLFPIHIHTEPKKIISDFLHFALFFSTDLNLSDQADKNMDRQGISRPFRIWAYFPPISKPRDGKNYFRFLYIFFLFFSTDLILSYQADKNMDRQGISGYGPIAHPYLNTEPKKIISYFLYSALFFSTDIILSDQADKNMDRQGISWPFRIWAYFPPISKHRAEKNYFDFLYFSSFFSNDLILTDQAD